MAENSPHVSRGRLEEIGLGDPSFTVELIDIMLSDGQLRVSKLRDAFDAASFEDVGRIAHSLKGAALNIGAGKLAELCSEIDKTVRKLNETIEAQRVEALEAEFRVVASELSSIRSELAS
ncbi:MAG: Hpt domain-containing protein [Calditrichaeota bacterium]|nr:Hpt domain-containing protein [Calditrichota bacterium]